MSAPRPPGSAYTAAFHAPAPFAQDAAPSAQQSPPPFQPAFGGPAPPSAAAAHAASAAGAPYAGAAPHGPYGAAPAYSAASFGAAPVAAALGGGVADGASSSFASFPRGAQMPAAKPPLYAPPGPQTGQPFAPLPPHASAAPQPFAHARAPSATGVNGAAVLANGGGGGGSSAFGQPPMPTGFAAQAYASQSHAPADGFAQNGAAYHPAAPSPFGAPQHQQPLPPQPQHFGQQQQQPQIPQQPQPQPQHQLHQLPPAQQPQMPAPGFGLPGFPHMPPMPSMMGAAASPAMSPAAASAPVLAPAPSPPPPPPPPPSRIDPRQVPRAEVDKPGAMVTFSTRAGGVPPSSLSQYIAEDDGNCSPRFMRLTTTQVAFDDDLVESTKLVVGVVFQPLASPHEGEAPVPVVDAGPQGPIRCLRCRAYMNSWNKFVAEGRQYVCSVCYTPNPVPDYYYCNLDANGVRRDRAERAELSRGSVEWVATPDFIQRPPQDPCYLFVLDVSYAAAATGLIDTAVEAVRGAIALVAQNPRARVGIVTYHQELQFYSVRPTRKEPQMFVVSDADDPFVPVPPQDLLVRPSDPDARLLLERVLEMIPTLYKAGRVEGCAFGAAVKAAGSALALTGGKVLVTQSNLPSVGAGALKNRDDIKLYFTEKEAQLFVPQTSFYQELATECAERFVTVDVFVAANSYVDLATTSALATTTGGQIYFYEGFSASKHAEALVSDLQRNVARPTGFEAVMLVRANDALKPSEYYGNFFRRHPNEMELPTVDADKCFGMTFKHEGKLPEKADVCIQCALLYTTAQGERRIRVHTLCVPVTTQLAMIYRSADLDAIVTLSLKQAGRQIFNTSTPAKVRTALVDACIDSLAVYRKFCAAASSPGQLILPEALKLLPLYSLGLIKNPLLHSGQRADERAFLFSYVASMPCAVAMPFVVPRLFNLGAVPSDALVPLTDRGNRVYLPPSCMLSSDSISAQSVYLLDNSRFLLMWVSDKADPELMAALFDGDEQKHQHGGHLRLSSAHLDDPSHLSTKVHTLLAQLRHSKPSFPPFAIVAHKHRRASTGGAAAAAAPDLAMETLDESAFFKYLVEDAGGLHTYAQSDDVNPNKTKEKDPSMMTYIDFLCYVHKRVQDKVY